jgi:hypothetical protein
MPHVDELLGITTLASMGLLVAVALQPMEVAQAVPPASVAPLSTPVAAGVRAPIAEERT